MPKRTIRYGVWETNSSSSHSLTLGTLQPEQEDIDFKFESISIKPMHFGYNYYGNGIVAPFQDSNNFPGLDKLCAGCEFLESKTNPRCQRAVYVNGNVEYVADVEHRCKNPDLVQSTTDAWIWIDWNSCREYQDAVKKMIEKLTKEQTPDIRACALFTCIVCKYYEPSKLLYIYFDNLFKICKEVKYCNKTFNQIDNSIDFWSDKIIDGRWDRHDSQVWMEEHGDLTCDGELLVDIVSDITKLKRYLFGDGAYAAGDRVG